MYTSYATNDNQVRVHIIRVWLRTFILVPMALRKTYFDLPHMSICYKIYFIIFNESRWIAFGNLSFW
jgi:hypothetical protein